MSRADPPQNLPIQDGGPKETSTPAQGHKRRNLSLANITIPSALTNLSILKRKPLPANSPIATQQRSLSLDSPKLSVPGSKDVLTPIQSPGTQIVVRDLDSNPHGLTPVVPRATPSSIYSQSTLVPTEAQKQGRSPTHSRNSSAPTEGLKSRDDKHRSRPSGNISSSDWIKGDGRRRSVNHTRSTTMTSFASQQSGLHLRIDGNTPNTEDELHAHYMPTTPSDPPRKLSNFFGWKSSRSPGGDSPSTNFSERSSSLPVSPMPVQENGYSSGPRLAPPAALDISKANSAAQAHFYLPGTPGLPTPPASSSHMAELELELREISSELANSIKREMELEDEVERMRSDPQASTGESYKRTSDYYSDSGAGSVRYPFGDNDGKIEQLERLRRAAEQEKAQLKLDMSQRLQDTLRQRRELEDKVQSLHQHMQTQSREQADNERTRELEATLSDVQRRLGEEKQFRENFQDLVEGMRMEIEQYRLERDNLRDEVVPKMRAQIEGLESDAVQSQSLTYEHTRMQQELQAMRDENQTLQTAKRMQLDTQQQQARFSAITEEGSSPVPPSPQVGGVSRSKSFANRGGRTSRSNSASGGALGRVDSVKEKTYESREVLTQKVKDIETQRDALHKALKSLLDRHVYNEKLQAKRLWQLETERDKFMSLTPRRTAFHTEVKHLKDEITTLRRRGDDALDQKWRCEKGLGGLKMDLDRAKQETTSLRALLQERDIFIPDRPGSNGGAATASGSLDKAYSELRTTQALSIARIKDMEAGDGSFNADAERTLELLKHSISDAEAERDRAHKQAEAYRQQATTLRKSELEHLGKEQSLASELYASATRMDDLANQVQTQLESNSNLRQRLAEAIERGEKDQIASSSQISQMQRRLRELEDKLMIAQQYSEESVNSHEAEVKHMQESQNAQLQRTAGGMRSPAMSIFAMKSPRLDKTTSGAGISIAEATKTGRLEERVKELEKALTEADKEMGEVVSRMNMAQMEVAELQGERDEAMMRTRKLQANIVNERERVQMLMSK